MAKTLKQIFTKEERIPLPNDETNKKVKDKHPVKKTKDANGNDDKLFKASNQKPSKTNANKDAVSEAVGISNDDRKEFLKAKKDGKSYKPHVQDDDNYSSEHRVKSRETEVAKHSKTSHEKAPKQSKFSKAVNGTFVKPGPANTKNNEKLRDARADRKAIQKHHSELEAKSSLERVSQKADMKKARNESFTTEAVGVSNSERRHALNMAKIDKSKEYSKTYSNYYEKSHDADKDHDRRMSKWAGNIKKRDKKGRPNSDEYKRSIRSAIKTSHTSNTGNQKSLVKNASKVVHKEEAEHIEEGYAEQKAAYMASSIKKANQICTMITKLANCKYSNGEPYYYDSKYLYRQLEDMYDNLESQYDNYKKSKQNNGKIY